MGKLPLISKWTVGLAVNVFFRKYKHNTSRYCTLLYYILHYRQHNTKRWGVWLLTNLEQKK